MIIQSIVSLAQVSAEMAALVQRAQNGDPVTEAEWSTLQGRLDLANETWESA